MSGTHVITTSDGVILASFDTEQERDDALHTGEYPEDAEPAFVNEPHVAYPHEPGRLYDCPACESRCHCTPGTAECVFDGPHNQEDQ